MKQYRIGERVMSTNENKKIRKKAEIPVGETKEHKFVRVATPRVKNAISKIRLVAQIISSNNYSMNREQVNSIYSMLLYEIAAVNTAFDSRNKSTVKEDIEVNL